MNGNSFEAIIKIIGGTPLWVWGVLGYLIFRGVNAIKPHKVYLPRLLILPLILILLRYTFFTNASSTDLMIYGSCLVLGILVGAFVASKIDFHVIKDEWLVELPGNYHTLVILVLFFAIKYLFGFLRANDPSLAIHYSWLEAAGTALLPGFFLGKTVVYARKFIK